jgi:hypothetical protein
MEGKQTAICSSSDASRKAGYSDWLYSVLDKSTHVSPLLPPTAESIELQPLEALLRQQFPAARLTR